MAEATPTSIDLITAAFSSMLGVDVVPLHKVPESAIAHSKKVSIHDLFTATHYMGGMQSGMLPQALEVAGQEFGINVRSFTGTRIATVPVTQNHTIAQIKEFVQKETGIPTINQKFLFNSSSLQDGDTVRGLGIFPRCNLIVIDGKDITKTTFYMDPEDLAPEYDYDFTYTYDLFWTYYRGYNDVDGKYFVYSRPRGWKRFALKVQGKPEYHYDDTWLGPKGPRTASAPNEWPVSYHGTTAGACGSIHDTGYDPNRSEGQVYGPGIYCTPDIRVAETYAKRRGPFECNRKKYLCVLQNRVNPDKIVKQYEEKSDDYYDKTVVLIDKKVTKYNAICSGEYWRCPRHDPGKGIFDIRPYGILIRKA